MLMGKYHVYTSFLMVLRALSLQISTRELQIFLSA
jgi:hypothetical protein